MKLTISLRWDDDGRLAIKMDAQTAHDLVDSIRPRTDDVKDFQAAMNHILLKTPRRDDAAPQA